MRRNGVWNFGFLSVSFCLSLGSFSGRNSALKTVLGRNGESGENVSSRSPVHLNLPGTAGVKRTTRAVSQRPSWSSPTTASSKVKTTF